MYCRTAIHCSTAIVEAVPGQAVPNQCTYNTQKVCPSAAVFSCPTVVVCCSIKLSYGSGSGYGVVAVGVMLLSRMRVSHTQQLSVLSYR